jgi:hypothetical protein
MAAREPSGEGWSEITRIRATYDPGWLYLLLETAGKGAVDWSRTSFSIGLDTYDENRGERRLPPPADCSTTTGIEFAVVLSGPDASQLVVTPAYRRWHPAESGAIGLLASPTEPAGHYIAPTLETNRERFTRAGQRIPAQGVEPGRLRFGTLDPAQPGFDSRTDVAVGSDAGVIELRLPWALLNFSDPSTANVLHNPARTATPGTTPTNGIRVSVCSADTGPSGTRLLRLEPSDASVRLHLENWVQPAFVLEPKRGLEHLVEAFRNIPDSPAAPVPGAGS